MSTLLKTKYILFEPTLIRTVHDLEVYQHELMTYIKRGYTIKARVSCTQVDDEQCEHRDIFNNMEYFTSTPKSTIL